MARRRADQASDRRLVMFVDDLLAVLQIPEVAAQVRDLLNETPPAPDAPPPAAAVRRRPPGPASGRGRGKGRG